MEDFDTAMLVTRSAEGSIHARWKVWFPGGKSDPSIALIRFDTIEGGYWENGGSRGIRFLVKAAKAYLKGTGYEGKDEGMNEKVTLA